MFNTVVGTILKNIFFPSLRPPSPPLRPAGTYRLSCPPSPLHRLLCPPLRPSPRRPPSPRLYSPPPHRPLPHPSSPTPRPANTPPGTHRPPNSHTFQYPHRPHGLT